MTSAKILARQVTAPITASLREKIMAIPIPPEVTAKAERANACVNALAGIADPAALRAALEELRKVQRNLHNDETTTVRDFFISAAKVIDLLPPETP